MLLYLYQLTTCLFIPRPDIYDEVLQTIHGRLDKLDEPDELDEEVKESLDQLQVAELELDGLQQQYKDIQDTRLTFLPGTSQLSYNTHSNNNNNNNNNNKSFHTYQESLQQLLLKLDSIPSHNNNRVRSQRKAVVLKIQNIVDTLDEMINVQKNLK